MAAIASAGGGKTPAGLQWKYLLAGGIAGAVSRTATAPLERIKIFNQVQDVAKTAVKYTGVIPALKKMYIEEGLRGYFKGNGTNVIKVIPNSAIRFASFQLYKDLLLHPGEKQLSGARKLVAGASAGVTAVAGTYPLDLIRTRLSIQTKEGRYRGMLHCAKVVIKEEGLAGLYKGVTAGILSVAPFSAVNFATYETIKETVARLIPDPPVGLTSLYGAASGTVSMTILYPLDLVKRRMMIQGQGGNLKLYKNVFDCFYQIVKQEGFVALYKGIIPSYLKVVPTVSLTFYTYEVFLTVFFPEDKAKAPPPPSG